MSTHALERTTVRQPATNALAELHSAHLAAAAAVAQLDLDDRRLWRRVDPTVAGLATSAYRLAAAVTGERPGEAAAAVPPVVRARELASAQQRLFRALDRHPVPPAELVAHAGDEVRRLAEQLTD